MAKTGEKKFEIKNHKNGVLMIEAKSGECVVIALQEGLAELCSNHKVLHYVPLYGKAGIFAYSVIIEGDYTYQLGE